MEWKGIWRISRKPSITQNIIDQKLPESAEYFNYLGSMIANDATSTREVKSRIVMAKQYSTRSRIF
jgi:hypothetical protein